jgi:biopolymer transport protein ExbD
MAGSFSSSSDDEVFAGINVTPLVDVVLVLLIIFMITAPVLYQSAIKVQLPKATTGEQNQKSNFNFTLTKEGNLLWNKDIITWEQLTQRLKAVKTPVAEETAMISADEGTPHGTVVKLMDSLREAGLTHFAIQTESR